MKKLFHLFVIFTLYCLPPKAYAVASYYTNVSEMSSDLSLKLGMTVTTQGYWKSNDGGGGTYIVVKSGEQNGGDVIKLKNGLFAKLLYDGRTFNLKQWGISGDVAIRYVKDIYPFLSDKDIKAINPEFDAKTTAETYVIQYLINKKPNNTIIVLDGNAYYISNTIHLRSFRTIRGQKAFDQDTFGSRIQQPGYNDVCTFYTSSVMMMIVPDKDMFDTGNNTLQNVQMENFSACGVMGKEGFSKKYSGNFLTQTSIISKAKFKNLCISNFNYAFYKNREWIWTMFEGLVITNMRYIGIYLPSDDGNQVNCNTIRDCRFSKCGVDYDSKGNLVLISLSKPIPSKGNCIILGGSGNAVMNCDLSHSPVGLFLQSYSNGTTVVGTYCEGAKISTYYLDYNEGQTNLDSSFQGGYISKRIKQKTTISDFRK